MTLLAQIVILAPLAHPPPAQDRQVAARVARVLQARAQHARFVHVLHRRARARGAARVVARARVGAIVASRFLRVVSRSRGRLARGRAIDGRRARRGGDFAKRRFFDGRRRRVFDDVATLRLPRRFGARHSATTDAATDRARDGSRAGKIK